MVIVDLETCEIGPVSPTRTLGPLTYFQNALVTAEELQAGWATAVTRYATTIDADTWTLERSDGSKQVFTRLEVKEK